MIPDSDESMDIDDQKPAAAVNNRNNNNESMVYIPDSQNDDKVDGAFSDTK